MLQITDDYKSRVLNELFNARANYDGSDSAFAKKTGISSSVFSRLKNGSTDGLLSNAQWFTIGRELNIRPDDRKWTIVKTEVYNTIEEDILFCKEYSKARIFVDDCEIGKTVAARHLSRTLSNVFYVDASQSKTKQLFIRNIAKSIGVDYTGKYVEVKENIKYYLQMLPKPLVIIDDAGDLKSEAFLELKELWNATENFCGWYMIGDDSLQNYITKSISNKKSGFRAVFSRFSSSYSSVTPCVKGEKLLFYRKLIQDVLAANIGDKQQLPVIVNQCLKNSENGQIGGLRRAESILILNQ